MTVLGCLIVGRCTANSFVDDVDFEDYLLKNDPGIVYYGMGYDPDTNVGYVNNEEVQSVEDLEQEDVVVLKGKLVEGFRREKYYECILSQVEVVECYSGALHAGDQIHMFEPVDCRMKEQMHCTDGYSVMQNGKEYILFLKQLQNTYFGSGAYVYAPVSTCYGKYPVDHNQPVRFTNNELEEIEKLHPYSQMKDMEVYLYDEKEYEKYLELKNQVLDKYQ